jgi:hypothetical protein
VEVNKKRRTNSAGFAKGEKCKWGRADKREGKKTKKTKKHQMRIGEGKEGKYGGTSGGVMMTEIVKKEGKRNRREGGWFPGLGRVQGESCR